MIDSLLTKPWALEPRFHNLHAALILKKLQSGHSLADLQASWQAQQQQHAPYYTSPKAGHYDQHGAYHDFDVVGGKAGKVAIISNIGSMTRYGGMCSYGMEDMASWIIEANQLDYISAIVLNINSPGGEVDGTELLGNVVKQSQKPVVAHIAGMGASAAYWVASQAKEIIMESPTTSEVGSIGVLAMHVDASAFYEKEGYKVTIVRSDGSEDKALFNSVEPLSAQVLESVKADLNLIKGTFIEAVQTGRPNISDKVFTGKMYPGKDAIKLGMADRFGYLGDSVYRADLLARKG